MDTKTLTKRVEKSLLLSAEEKKYWLGKLPAMKEVDLKELDSILEYAEKIDWEKAVKEYAEAGEKAEAMVQMTVSNL